MQHRLKNRVFPIAAVILTAVMLLCLRAVTGTAKAEGEAIPIDEGHFPDPNFRAVLATADYDRDGDGYLSAEEIALTINIHCDGMGIQSLAGIEYFTSLQGLYCTQNAIADWDLSRNTDLRGVWCSNNLFTSIDLSANRELVWLYCYECRLTSLNVSNNPKLAFLECNTNPLPELILTNNPELEHLTCGSCQLSVLDLSGNPKLSHLDAFRNNLTSLNLSVNTKLKRLDIWDNHGLGNVNVSHLGGLQYYNCANNGVTSLDMSGNPELQKLICSYNSITSLNVSNNPKLFYLDCACNRIGSLNLANNPLLHFLQAFTNPFTVLDISANGELVKTYREGVKKEEYQVCRGHSWTLDYGGETSTGGDNLYFLCFDDAVTLTVGPDPQEQQGNNQNQQPDNNQNNGQEATGELVKREALAQRLYEMAGSPSVEGLTTRFHDVKPGTPSYNAIVWGEKIAMCMGYPNVSSDNFGVGEWIQRQDVAFMLMRYSEAVGYKRAIDFGRSDDFSDYFEIDDYAWEAITWAATWNIMVGKGDPDAPKEQRRIAPHDKATAAEIDTMITRMLEVNGYAKPQLQTATPTPTPEPTKAPTEAPTQPPANVTQTPTEVPTQAPTQAPTKAPTEVPAKDPTKAPTPEPTGELAEGPTKTPDTDAEATLTPTVEPTETPTSEPTEMPTPELTKSPDGETGEAGLTLTVTPAETEQPTAIPELTEAPGDGVPTYGITPTAAPAESDRKPQYLSLAILLVGLILAAVFVLKRKK